MTRIDRELRGFLRREKAYASFCHYFRDHGELSPKGTIELTSIKWYVTKEGVSYWMKLMLKYSDLKNKEKIREKYFK